MSGKPNQRACGESGVGLILQKGIPQVAISQDTSIQVLLLRLHFGEKI